MATVKKSAAQKKILIKPINLSFSSQAAVNMGLENESPEGCKTNPRENERDVQICQ